MVTTLATKPVTLNLHHYSVLANEVNHCLCLVFPLYFASETEPFLAVLQSKLHPALATFFDVVATNTVDGVSFVSLMEGRELPFYASQFHPEK